MSDKEINVLLKTINKKYGENTILTMGSSSSTVNFVPTGIPSLDLLLGGGMPLGRIVEISGNESSGKTTLALETMAQFAKAFPDKSQLFVDAEHALDVYYAYHLGVPINNEDKILFSQPDSGEEAMNVMVDIILSGKFSIVILDSLSSLEPERVQGRDLGDADIGSHAKLSSDSLRRLAKACAKTGCTLIILNQERANLTAMGAFGTVTAGGNAIKFYTSLRVKLKSSKPTNAFPNLVPIQAKVIKSKTGAKLFQTTEYLLSSEGAGIQKLPNSIQYAIETGNLIVKGGGYLDWEKEDGVKEYISANKLRGMEKITAALFEDTDFCNMFCESLGIPQIPVRGPLDRERIKLELVKK